MDSGHARAASFQGGGGGGGGRMPPPPPPPHPLPLNETLPPIWTALMGHDQNRRPNNRTVTTTVPLCSFHRLSCLTCRHFHSFRPVSLIYSLQLIRSFRSIRLIRSFYLRCYSETLEYFQRHRSSFFNLRFMSCTALTANPFEDG